MLFFSTSVLNQLQNEVCTMLVLAHLNIGWILVLHQLYTLRCPEFVYAHPGPPKYRMDSSTKPTIQLFSEWRVYYVSTSPPKYRMDSSTTGTVHQKVLCYPPKYRMDSSTKPSLQLIAEWSVYYVSTSPPRSRMDSSTTPTVHPKGLLVLNQLYN